MRFETFDFIDFAKGTLSTFQVDILSVYNVVFTNEKIRLFHPRQIWQNANENAIFLLPTATDTLNPMLISRRQPRSLAFSSSTCQIHAAFGGGFSPDTQQVTASGSGYFVFFPREEYDGITPCQQIPECAADRPLLML